MAFTQKHVNIVLVSIAVVILIIVIYHYSCTPSEREHFQNQCVIQRASIDKLATDAAQKAAKNLGFSGNSVPSPVTTATPTVTPTAPAATPTTATKKQSKVRGVLESTDQAAVTYTPSTNPQHQRPSFKKGKVRGIKEDLKGAPILKKVNYPAKDVTRNDGTFTVDGESNLEGGMGFSIGGLGNYHMDEQNKCAITKGVFQKLNNNGYLTDDQIPRTWNKLFKGSCGGWA